MEQLQIDPSLRKDLVVGSVTFRSACDFDLTEADLQIAREELGETEDVKKHALEKLKEMIANDKHVLYRTDDGYLMRFLRFRKFDIEKTFKYIKGFYTMRNEDPSLFSMPSDVEDKTKGNFFNLMPYTDEDGSIVYLLRFGPWNPSTLNVRGLLNMYCYVSDVLTMNPHLQINGIVGIWDFGSITMDHYMAMMNPLMVRFYMKFIQDVYPWRVKKIIIFNCSKLAHTGVSTVRYFLKKKIADRLILIRSDLDELHKHVNPAILPKEYGGCLADDECYSYLKKLLFSNKKYIQYENTFICKFK